MKNIALYGRFGEPAASIFREHPPPGLSVSHWPFRSFVRLSMRLYRGFAPWSRNLGKLLLDCMASHPTGLCSTECQTMNRYLPSQNDAET